MTRSGRDAGTIAESELEEELRRAAEFRSALRHFSARTEEVAASAGLTPQRYDLLLAIRAGVGATSTVTQLSQRLRLRQTTVTELVKRAEEAGLVLRAQSREDGRVTVIRLSREGRRRFFHAFLALQKDRDHLRLALREVGVRFRALADDKRRA